MAALSNSQTAIAQSASQSALQLNDSGDAVSEVQRRLQDLGYYSGEITGFYGSMTQDAVARFQRDKGLTDDGIVGSATESALRNPSGQTTAAATPRSFVHLGDSGPQITELQRRLAELGYYKDSASGSFDQPTEEAVIRFQQDNGLPADGIVGPDTEIALRQPSGQAPQSAQSSSASSAQSASSYSGNRSVAVLRLGDTGAAVSELQGRLSEQGFYRGAVTGSYDTQTQAAVMELQRSKNLAVDGIAGPQVASALGIAGATGSNTPGATSGQDLSWRQLQQMRTEAQQARTEAEQAKQEAEQAQLEAEQARLVLNQNLQEGRYSVASLQRSLQANGYNPGEINGVLTTDTENAITEAQRRYGLSEADLFSNTFPQQ